MDSEILVTDPRNSSEEEILDICLIEEGTSSDSDRRKRLRSEESRHKVDEDEEIASVRATIALRRLTTFSLLLVMEGR